MSYLCTEMGRVFAFFSPVHPEILQIVLEDEQNHGFWKNISDHRLPRAQSRLHTRSGHFARRSMNLFRSGFAICPSKLVVSRLSLERKTFNFIVMSRTAISLPVRHCYVSVCFCLLVHCSHSVLPLTFTGRKPRAPLLICLTRGVSSSVQIETCKERTEIP